MTLRKTISLSLAMATIAVGLWLFFLIGDAILSGGSWSGLTFFGRSRNIGRRRRMALGRHYRAAASMITLNAKTVGVESPAGDESDRYDSLGAGRSTDRRIAVTAAMLARADLSLAVVAVNLHGAEPNRKSFSTSHAWWQEVRRWS
jgi:hypothetical protein